MKRAEAMIHKNNQKRRDLLKAALIGWANAVAASAIVAGEADKEDGLDLPGVSIASSLSMRRCCFVLE